MILGVVRRLDWYTTRVNIAQTWIIGITKEKRAVICHEKPSTHKLMVPIPGFSIMPRTIICHHPVGPTHPLLFPDDAERNRIERDIPN